MLLKNSQIATFIERQNRYTAITSIGNVWCANPGRMSGLLIPNEKIIISQSNKSFTWEAAFVENTWVGTNTHNPNKLVREILNDLFPNEIFLSEVSFTSKDNQKYRADFVSESKIVEVKNVHWKRYHDQNDSTAYFPDCITARGAKQVNILNELSDKYECYIIYVVQRNDVQSLTISSDIDKNYALAIRNNKNIKSLAFNTLISFNDENNITEIKINQEIPYVFV
jgi:sugar fermentation stimulation protein A